MSSNRAKKKKECIRARANKTKKTRKEGKGERGDRKNSKAAKLPRGQSQAAARVPKLTSTNGDGLGRGTGSEGRGHEEKGTPDKWCGWAKGFTRAELTQAKGETQKQKKKRLKKTRQGKKKSDFSTVSIRDSLGSNG